jgi:isoamylase
MEVWSGSHQPLGAHFDGSGTQFSVYSGVADHVELCLFDDQGAERRISLPAKSADCWHGYVTEVYPGQRYGYRVHGPYAPHDGHRCDPSKLLLDPYARAIDGDVRWHDALFRRGEDTARHMPRAVVIGPHFDWRDDRPPRTPWDRTVIYELHVKGFTQRHPAVPSHLRGTYAALAHPAVIGHLLGLGVTAVELLPIHHFVSERPLAERGAVNFWGYNSIGYFAPHQAYAARAVHADGAVREFQTMVRELHRAGIEVLLDVVFNHTGEGSHLGPTLSFRGLDNASYYRLMPGDPSRYLDFSGCGNALDTRHPYVLQLLMDSLRYWVAEMHVDGFRFDLAPALARDRLAFDRTASFLQLVHQDPVLRRVKLIAEPWDLGDGGYQVGGFPPPWSEWNGRYRDAIRDVWRGRDGALPEFAARFAGSADLYQARARRTSASINFVTCHDGFTLRDLVSYNEKHNADNGEDNRDGEQVNRSWNCGVEGETTDGEVLALRARQVRNLLTTLLLSQGVPMLLAGDELGRTQRGNNNAYCQDNAVSWLDWDHADAALCAFVRGLLGLRARHPVLRRTTWFTGTRVAIDDHPDIGWYRPDGAAMTPPDWLAAHHRALGVFLHGDGIEDKTPTGDRISGHSLFIALNASTSPCVFSLPAAVGPGPWRCVVDTELGIVDGGRDDLRDVGGTLLVAAHAIVVLRDPR